jgi:hypothetical protein
MPTQLKLTLDAADDVRIASAANLHSALVEKLRVYFQQTLSEEEHTQDDGKDHCEP